MRSPSSPRIRPVPSTMSETSQPVRPKRRWLRTRLPFQASFHSGWVLTTVLSLM